MTNNIKIKKHRQNVIFKRRAMTRAPPSTSTSNHLEDLELQPSPSGFVIEEILDDQSSNPQASVYQRSITHISQESACNDMTIPDLFTTSPPLRDLLNTSTSQLQEKTVQEVLPFLSGIEEGIKYNDHGVPRLDRKRHIQFLHKSLKGLSAGYVPADASRPWYFYWALAGLSTMGEDPTEYRERLISSIRPIQNASGGFGGGMGQFSHLAPSYAIVLSLALVGGNEALDSIDRKAMWKWLCALKQPDGGFQMSAGGEEDVRGAYCAMVLIRLLNLPIELTTTSPAWTPEGATLLTGLPEWISRCQSFEGGLAERPDAEAHGAYAFCALGCLSILGEPHITIPKYIDVPLLISWLSARQNAPEGGFSGRTNKLVDGCYSHWVGGCWPLIEACLGGPSVRGSVSSRTRGFFSREGLIRYILCCCQDFERGGLRDKPSHKPDPYHTCYVLAGLSMAQHKWHFTTSSEFSSGSMLPELKWTSEPVIEDPQIYDEKDRVRTVDPVFVIPEGVAERTQAYFASKGGF